MEYTNLPPGQVGNMAEGGGGVLSTLNIKSEVFSPLNIKRRSVSKGFCIFK